MLHAPSDVRAALCMAAEWESNLLEFARQHPEVAVIDSVDGIRTVQNRSTMLSPLQGDGILIHVSVV